MVQSMTMTGRMVRGFKIDFHRSCFISENSFVFKLILIVTLRMRCGNVLSAGKPNLTKT